MRKLNNKKIFRCQFELDEESIEFLDELKRTTGLASKADFVRSALRLAKRLTEELKKGNKVVIKRKWWQKDSEVFLIKNEQTNIP